MEDVVGSEEVSSESIISVKMNRFSKLDIFRSAQLLIFTDEVGNISVVKQTLDQIRQINAPLNIVGICGPYRTGKSFLANYIANGKRVFELGHSTESHTKGIWAKCQRHPKQIDQILMVLDTEGFENAKKISLFDNYLFTLTFLLSSTLIYNTIGVVKKELMDKLEIITNLPDYCHMSEDANKRTSDDLIPFVSPNFILCLRDFYLQLPKDCKNTDDYFESCLKENTEPGYDDYNKSRHCIRSFFPVRRCFVFDRPAASRKLTRLDELDEKEFEATFTDNMLELRAYVYDCPFKRISPLLEIQGDPKPIDGLVFEILARNFAETLHAHRPIQFDKVFERAAGKHNNRVTENILGQFTEQVSQVKLPIKDRNWLHEQFSAKRSQLLAKYRRMSYPYHPDIFEDKIVDKMTALFNELEEKNAEKIFLDCSQVLTKMHEQRKLQLRDTKGDQTLSQVDLQEIEQCYRTETLPVQNWKEREDAFEQFEKTIRVDARTKKYNKTRTSGLSTRSNKRDQVHSFTLCEEIQNERTVYYDQVKEKIKVKIEENNAFTEKYDDWWCILL